MKNIVKISSNIAWQKSETLDLVYIYSYTNNQYYELSGISKCIWIMISCGIGMLEDIVEEICRLTGENKNIVCEDTEGFIAQLSCEGLIDTSIR